MYKKSVLQVILKHLMGKNIYTDFSRPEADR